MASRTGAPATPDGKGRSSREDVLQFLDSLDTYSASPRSASAAAPVDTAPASMSSPAKPPVASAEEAQSVLDFLDEITQRSSTPTAPVRSDSSTLGKKASSGVLSRSTSRTNVAVGAAGGVPSTQPRRSGESARSVRQGASDSPGLGATASGSASTPAAEKPAEGGWGWSSVWSQASSVVQQASNVAQQVRTVAEEQVKTASSSGAGIAGNIGGLGEGLLKALGDNEQAKKWSEGAFNYVKGAHLDQLGKDLKSTTLKSLTDLLNAVAPPIAEHEVLKVSLSHDMVGYDGVETLVYNALAKVMEQIEGGTLIVNKGNEEKPREHSSEDPDERDLNTVEGFAEGWKLAQANIDELIKHSFKPEAVEEKDSASSLTVPVTTCPIYIRIQPTLAPMPYASPNSASETASSNSLYFLFLLRDPTHTIVHTTLSQAMPAAWLDIPFEENEWVEDIMVNVIRQGIEVLGKEYIDTRMHAQSIAIAKARDAATQALAQTQATSPAPPPSEPIVTEDGSVLV